MEKRQNFIQKLQVWAERVHSGITNGQEQLVLEYRPSFPLANEEEPVLFERFMVKLSEAKEQEFRRGSTLVGPHRDDVAFFINGREVQTYGSQGQQRTAALSLKLAELELIHEEVGEYPILLLDDVLSELDRYRQTQLIETFQTKVQTFITTTGIESVNLANLHEAAVFHVENGRLVPQITGDRELIERMFIHLGGEKIIRSSELIAIFDLSVEKNSKISKQFIAHAAEEKKIEVIGEEESKSLVITPDKVYYSPISSTTLKKRSNQLYL